MKSFNVLDRRQNIDQNYLLEASAGTGKTFSIENIVVRLLLEKELSIEQILVVTFTKAATRDLKIRIRSNIEKTIGWLQNRAGAPDYVQAVSEPQKGVRILERALASFDQAQIFTIHSFCSRMLRDHVFEGDMGFSRNEEETLLSKKQLLRIIRDYFRTEMTQENISQAQLKIVSNEKLEMELLSALEQGWKIEPKDGFRAQLESLNVSMRALKGNYSAEKIVADFIKQAPSYSGLCDRKGNIKAEHVQDVEWFASLFEMEALSEEIFERLIEDGLTLLEKLDPEKLKVRKAPAGLEELHYPSFLETVRAKLFPIVLEARNPSHIFAKIASGCQQLAKTVFDAEEKMTHEDTLQNMLKAISNPHFCSLVRRSYKAAIVDEFQDTDPVQWEIFRTLFMPQNIFWGHLYLVGDPKQSIYSFRRADVYTYLAAAQAMGPEHQAVLDTNYRSQPLLVEALNTLFSSENVPGLIALPRTQSSLDCRPVKFSSQSTQKAFSDGLGCVHFLLARVNEMKDQEVETRIFNPFIANEIQKLNREEGVALRNIAVLVKDRYQASRLSAAFDACGIPWAWQKSTDLSASLGLQALRELLQAVLRPKNESSLKVALGGPIIGWSLDQMKILEENNVFAEVMDKFLSLRNLLFQNGFAAFFESILQSRWHGSSETASERMIRFGGSIEFYRDLQLISQILIEEEGRRNASPEALLLFLYDLEDLDCNDDERLKKFADTSRDCVNILTLHSSKGLEFEVVFALGLASRSKVPEHLFPTEDGRLEVALDGGDLYRRYCEEVDAEKLRQLYVGMTRAKFRLYVPAVFGAGVPKIGQASPMELFLAHLTREKPENLTAIYERIENGNETALCNFIERSGASITYALLSEKSSTAAKRLSVTQPKSLHPPQEVDVPNRRQAMHSFTSLSRGGESTSSMSVQEMPHDFYVKEKSPHTLPCGAETGLLLHAILETIPFHEISKVPDVKTYVKGTSFEGWETVIGQMVLSALTAPLIGSGEPFCLADIPEECRYHETEFVYPTQALADIEELKRFPGYVKGVMDLVFSYEGKYYLLDWKSNWLGPSHCDYSQERLEQAMKENAYFLQAEVYKKALERYLRLVDPRPFQEIFGGIFYVFLRGLKENHGVYTLC